MDNDKSFILSELQHSKNNALLREGVFAKKFPSEYADIVSYNFPTNFVFKQKIYHWLNNDFELLIGICPVCGKRCKFLDINRGYSKHCSKKCAANSINVKEKRLNTNLDRYGTTCSLQNKEVNKKTRKTCYEKYGDECYFKTHDKKEKSKKTYEIHFGVDHPSKSKEIQDKKRITCIEKYGVEYYFKTDEFKEKSRKTKKMKYDDPVFSNRKKMKLTCIERYGKDNPWKTDIAKENIRKTSYERYGVNWPAKAKSVIEKSKQTQTLNYGIKGYAGSKERATRDSERFKEVHELYVSRGIEKPNGISKIEILFYDYLTGKYGSNDIEIQYMSEKYPYKCDFYIKSLDVYVELNAHWTHGGHAFDKNDKNDIEKAKFWKSKDSKFYDIALMVWTVKDVEKRNLAKEKKLNYIELFCSDLENCVSEFEKQIASYD